MEHQKNLKKRIIAKNLNLSVSQIKQELREKWPEITNEEVENLIVETLKDIRNVNKIMQKNMDKKNKEKDDEIEK